MALNLRQALKQTQKLLMTPQLQQAINLLQLSRIELEQYLNKELQENPVLEIDDSPSVEEQVQSEKEFEVTDQDVMHQNANELVDIIDRGNDSSSDLQDKIDFENGDSHRRYEEQTYNSSKKSSSNGDDAFNYENVVSKSRTLSDHLLDQVREIDFDDRENIIAQLIIGSLDEKGYFETPLEELCKAEDFDLDVAEGVLDTLQRLDPPGICATSLQSCLLIQLRNLGLRNGVVEKIVEHHMKELSTRNFNVIARAMKLPLKKIIDNIQIISELNPVPARQYSLDKPDYVVPDVYVYKVSGKWVVSLNEDDIPHLAVNNFYEQLQDKAKGDDKVYLSEKIKNAQWLIKSLYQRQKTIYKVSETILEKQIDFFEKGIDYLKPMILRDIADEIEMHESTVSRVTSNKYMHTPRGIFELKYFFNSSVSTADGSNVASESVKSKIADMVKSEDVRKPFSDQKIVDMLEKEGINLARRTVAKYREQLGILPSSKRKKYF